MKSPHQAKAKSAVKTVTLEGGIKLAMPMSKCCKTPAKKTSPVICNGPKNC
jgi:hypothetical protein